MTEISNNNNKFAIFNSDSENEIEDNNINENKIKINYKNNQNSKKNISSQNITPKNIIEKVEDEMFKKYYGKKLVVKNNKINDNQNNFHIKNNEYFSNKKNDYVQNENDLNGFIKVNSRKNNDKVVIECLYKKIDSNFLDLNMDNYFKILAHHNDDKSWDYNSYHNITILKTWRDLGTFLKTLNTVSNECSYTDFDIFVMKNEISPMWEDAENRNGSICSIKIDSLTDGYEIFKNLTINMANNTLLKFNPSNWDTINGI